MVSSAVDRAWLRIERFLWFFVAALVGGAWVFYEAITGKEVPGHAHPVFATFVAAALAFGGADLRRIARVRRDLLAVAREAGLTAEELEGVAHRVAVLEVEDPQLVRALRALAPPASPQRRRPKTDPVAIEAPPGRSRRRPTASNPTVGADP